jgi:hypothetical protein
MEHDEHMLERRHYNRRNCEDHAECIARFEGEVRSLGMKISELCEWKKKHDVWGDQVKDKMVEQMHNIERNNAAEVAMLRGWLQTRTIAALAVLIGNLLAAISALAIIVVRT